MERLTTAQQDSINKTGTARLIVKLSKAGFPEADLDKMDRPALIAAWAECVASGKEVPTPVPSQTFGYDADLERQKLAFETRRFEAQQKERADDIARQEKAQEKARLDEIQRRREEFERDEKLRNDEIQRQEQLRLDDIERQERWRREEAEKQERIAEKKMQMKLTERDSAINRAKRYGDAIKASLSPMGSDILDILSFFRRVETVFERYAVPTDLQADLLQPYLNLKSRGIVCRMDPKLSRDYGAVRDLILREHKLTPAAYLEYFNTATKAATETCVMYSARLQAMLEHYVEARKVDHKYERLLSLIVCDVSRLPWGRAV